MKWTDHENINIPYYTFENLAEAGFPVNAFTTKHYRDDGRESDFFQLLMRSDSDPQEVMHCRSLLLNQFLTDENHLVRSAQKHTANIHLVTDNDLGPAENRPVLKETDGLVTDKPGVMLQTFGADCPSVFLADPVNRAIGLCHSGRKGTQNHICTRMLEVMMHEFGTDPSRALAAISPGICVSCYEVGTDVAEDFIRDYLGDHSENIKGLLEAGLSMGILQYINGRYHIDLPLSIAVSLKTAGIPEENLEISDLCTKCRSDIFYSFRAEGRISNENSAVFMIPFI